MKIGVIGATGRLGQAVVNKAIANNHEVTAFVRNGDRAQEMFGSSVKIIVKDAMDLTTEDLAGLDAVVDAFASNKAYQNFDLAAKLVADFREQPAPYLLFVIGASSLIQADGKMMLETVEEQAAGAPWIEAPRKQVHEFEFLQWVDNVQWTAVSPQMDFELGPETKYRLGKDEVMEDSNGDSKVSYGNFAAALVEEIETPKHVQQRFTVVDA